MRSCILFFLLGRVFVTQAQEFTSKVVSVIDGDTYEIVDPEGEIVKVMLSDVDAPELGQEFGTDAQTFSNELLYKKKVVVEFRGKDFFGNKLATIKTKKGQILHELLLENGLAMVRERKQDEALIRLQEKAKSSDLGIWSVEQPETPWTYRRKQTMLQAKSR